MTNYKPSGSGGETAAHVQMWDSCTGKRRKFSIPTGKFLLNFDKENQFILVHLCAIFRALRAKETIVCS